MIEYIYIVSIVAGVICIIAVIWSMMRRLMYRQAKMAEYFEHSIHSTISHLHEPWTAQVVSVAQKKKEAIQKVGPKTFYYIDESQVNDLYPQVFQELEPKRIETRESKETKKGITATLRLIEPKYERGRAEETIKIYDATQTPSIMYNKVEQYLLEKGKVTFGLEEFEFEKSPIDEFKSMCDQMRSKFNFNIPEDLQANFVSDKMNELALQHIERLFTSSGHVAIQTEFTIIDIPEHWTIEERHTFGTPPRNAYILSFVHPLNEHIPQEKTKVRIQITCAKKYMTPSGVSTFKKDKSVKITCLGKVGSWNNEDKILEVSPIAIY